MARRKFFSATVALGATTATSVLALMQAAIPAWCSSTNPNDSVIGSEISITPDAIVFVGHDSNVRAADGTPQYKGVQVSAGQNFSLQDFGGHFGTIDPSHIYLYSTPGANIALVFQGV